jgi:hypothetical protein
LLADAVVKLAAAALAVLLVADRGNGQTIEPDARLQGAIANAGRARDQRELEAKLGELAALGGKDFEKLVPQLVYFLMHTSDSHEAMLPAVIADRMHISDVQMAAGLVPYLGAKDEKLRGELDNLLAGIDDKEQGARRDFTAYAVILRRKPDAPPLALVRYMYRVDPDAAIDTMADVDPPPAAERTTLFAARDRIGALRAHRAAGAIVEPAEIDAARTAIAELARHRRWWARLYAAGALNALSELRARELVQSLRKDPHELVRDAANAIPMV